MTKITYVHPCNLKIIFNGKKYSFIKLYSISKHKEFKNNGFKDYANKAHNYEWTMMVKKETISATPIMD